jgi:hypothetical protein
MAMWLGLKSPASRLGLEELTVGAEPIAIAISVSPIGTVGPVDPVDSSPGLSRLRSSVSLIA